MIPSKQFIHQGTMYYYSGNEEMIESHFHEVRNHLLSMKRTNVNKLPILFGQKKFDDGTVALYKLIHGKEVVDIIAPVIIKKAGHIEIDQGEIRRVCPVFRSIDDKYWVACLSGTFEPDYYIFENIYDIPAEALDDKVEIDLDNQLISIGTTPIDDSIDDPELRFIAQTGHRDTGTPIGQNLFYDPLFSIIPDPRYATDSVGVKYAEYAQNLYGEWVRCPSGGASVKYTVDFFYSDTFYDYFTFKGVKINSPRVQIGWTEIREGTVGNGVLYDESGIYGTPPYPMYGWDKNFFGDATFTFNYSKIFFKGISIEDEVTNFASSYCDLVVDESEDFYSELVHCDWYYSKHDYYPWNYNAPHKRTYKFQVGDKAYDFYSPPPFTDFVQGFEYLIWDPTGLLDPFSPNYECRTEHNMLKYYGPDSKGKNTGIMCGRVDYFEYDDDGYYVNERCEGFYYNYVGPNKKDVITTTIFPPKDAIQPYTHVIPKIKVDNNDIIFKGEIFLGLVTYNVEIRNESFKV